jgi:hypothetical protein
MDSQPQRSQTRRRPRKPYPFEPKKEKDWSQDWYWPKFLKRGNELFDYMIHNFDSMFLNDTLVKHLEVREAGCYDIGGKEVEEKYRDEIQKQLVPWIMNEYKNEDLFVKEYWMPFRDSYTITDMYLGYRTLFKFKPPTADIQEESAIPALNNNGTRTYYFQLSIDECCDKDYCKFCDGNEDNTRFELVLWGWMDEGDIVLKPNQTKIDLCFDAYLISSQYWKPH